MSKLEFIDMTPSWVSLIDPMILVLQNPKASAESVETIRGELLKIARAADREILK